MTNAHKASVHAVTGNKDRQQVAIPQSMPLALAEETAVAVQINGINYVVMMLTPHDLDDFIVGFLLTQGVIEQVYDIHDIEYTETSVNYGKGIRVNVSIANRQAQKFAANIRLMQGTSGCGICGSQALENVFGPLPILANRMAFNTALLTNIRSKIKPFQTRSNASGAMHAAFFLDEHGSIILCREDIGRHNALDKVIGAAKKARLLSTNCALLITSRCSAELVQKAILAGVTSLVSLASPSNLALQIALEHRLTLIHIPKAEQAIVYQPNVNDETFSQAKENTAAHQGNNND